MQVNREWISISDMMAGLMMVFLFIAVLFMSEIQKEQNIIKEVAENYQSTYLKLNVDLHNEFNNDLEKWDAEILQDNTIRFKSPDVLFDSNSSQIKPIFVNILNNFFPRYLKILTSNRYKNEIQEIRIEGHTSSIWKTATTKEQSYLNNMRLSQNRAREVLAYVYKITKPKTEKRWLEGHLRGNGISFSKPITHDGKENIQASQRVEFRALTKAEEKLSQIIDKLQKSKL